MSFEADEEGVETSKPRECIKISHGNTVYRITNSKRDEVVLGELYTSTPSVRTEASVTTAGAEEDIHFSLPLSHAFTQRYLAGGVPPRRIEVLMYRLQSTSMEAECFWGGRVESMAAENRSVAKFLVPSLAAKHLRRNLPMATSGVACPHALYSPACGVDPDLFKVVTTVTNKQGTEVTVASMGIHADQWAQFGDLIHTSSGEGMTVFDHTGNVLTLQFPIWELQVGDEVTVYAGCPHEIGTCYSKFANQANFGGQPDIPSSNPHVPSGFGVYTSE